MTPGQTVRGFNFQEDRQMNDAERWDRAVMVARIVTGSLAVDEITPITLSVTAHSIEVTVPWDQVGWAATGIFADAQDLPVRDSYKCRDVTGMVDGVPVTIRGFQGATDPKPATSTVADLLKADQ